ncbi:MAG: hypothetical protein LUG54_10945 [Clostridiales bacterium]|nr:hypothetical protein [Clostridiales bacterium]
MSKFSQYLRKLFDENGESIASVARSIGAERTSIHKALSDERQLPYKVVRALATHFQLPLEERKEFFQLYNIDIQGEETWQNRQTICELLNQLSAVQFVSGESASERTDTILPCPVFGSDLLEGEYNIRHAIRSVMDYELSKNEVPVFRMYLPEDFCLTAELTDLWLRGDSFRVEQLFSFPSVSDHNVAQNIRQLRDIIPLCLVSKGAYRPYYFCEPTNCASLNPLNYYIVTPGFLIQLSWDFSTALIRTSSKLITYFDNYIQYLLEQCDPLANCSSDIMEILNRYILETDPESLLFMTSQPCLGRYFTASVISKYMRPVERIPYQAMFDAVEKRYSSLGKIQKRYYTIFSEKGLQHFIDTGVLTELPAQYALPIVPEDRVRFLTNLRDEIASGNVVGLIARPSRLHLPDDIFLYSDAKGCIHFDTTESFIYGAYSCDIHISEKNICEAFREFFLSLPDSYLVYTKEDTLRILENGIQKLTNKID